MARSDFVQHRNDVAWQRPLDAYLRLRAAGHAPFLLDGNGLHPEARFAFIGLQPHVEVRIRGHDIEERWLDGAMEFLHDDPIAYLRRTTTAHRFPVHESHPFTGGWMGLFGFGFAQQFEPSLPHGASAGLELPDAVLRLCLDAVVFDRIAGTAAVYCADLEGDTAACAQRAEAMAEILAGAMPRVDAVAAVSTDATWQESMPRAAFEEAVGELKTRIASGDLFQANLATQFSAPCSADPAALFAALQAHNPSPFMALVECNDFAIVSGSPEQLFSVRDGTMTSRPIAGTRKRSADAPTDAVMEAELRNDAKEQAEHTMLVDLVRNDVARVAQPGSVRVPERGSVERYAHVMHLASRVDGRVRNGTDFVDWLAALFPGGTVTGAPKLRATQRILEAEPVRRGFYTGSAGYLSWSHNAGWNILIRTLQLTGGRAYVHAGSGIVADSDPEREWHEAGRKARALLEAASGTARSFPAARLGEVTRVASWAPPTGARARPGKRVLLIDNMDSFVHNLADYCAVLGAAVRVVRNDHDWRRVAAEFAPTHVVLSPGPGWPDEAGCTLEVVRELHGTVPILGVCLGHQAIGQAAGARVIVHPSGPVHGKADYVLHAGAGLFRGQSSPLLAGRYHSLIVEAHSLPSEWLVDATLADGTVMALRHRTAPTYGLQFHPESLCTPRGLELLDRFLETTA